MANRIRAVEEKVQSVMVAFEQINVARAAHEAGIPASTLHYDLNKVKAMLPAVLVNQKPGPRPRPDPVAPAPARPASGAPRGCPACGGRLNKNGTYWVWNWVLLLLMGWLGVQKVAIQRWRCTACGHEVSGPERTRQAAARRAWWCQVARLVGLSRFKLGLSVRKTQILVRFVYGRPVAVGYIERLTQRVGTHAAAALTHLQACRQAVAHFLLYDETYPKMQQRAYSLGVAICEHGLIRSVRCVVCKAKDIPAQLRAVVGEHYQPEYFLTDLDVLFNRYLQDAGLTLIHLRDRVHLIRQIVRLFDEAVRDVTLEVPKGLPIKDRKQQRRLKQRLLRKQLQPLLTLAFKAFSPGYESLCVLLLEGIGSQLRDGTRVIQTASVQTLARRLQRFVTKHEAAINTLLQLAVEQGTPTTTNALESKNGILKPFSRIAKFFPLPARCQSFFAGVALMENFDVKTRGAHRGTSAMQRAQINLDDFGATDFFTTVGLPKPQISLVGITE
jgi:hypothetical protein